MVSKKVTEDIVVLLKQGYSIDSIHKFMVKKHKKMNIKQSDIVIISKKNNIKVGSKDIFKEKLNAKSVETMVPKLLRDKELVSDIKTKIVIILLSLLVLIVVIGFSISWKVALIILGGLFIIISISVLISYFKFIKTNKNLRDIIVKK